MAIGVWPVDLEEVSGELFRGILGASGSVWVPEVSVLSWAPEVKTSALEVSGLFALRVF